MEGGRSQSQTLAFEGACLGCCRLQGTVGEKEEEVMIIIEGTLKYCLDVLFPPKEECSPFPKE